MKGLPRHELEVSIQQIFRGADGDGSGALNRAEFLRCLKESGLGFTRRELNLILSKCDRHGEGHARRDLYHSTVEILANLVVQRWPRFCLPLDVVIRYLLLVVVKTSDIGALINIGPVVVFFQRVDRDQIAVEIYGSAKRYHRDMTSTIPRNMKGF